MVEAAEHRKLVDEIRRLVQRWIGDAPRYRCVVDAGAGPRPRLIGKYRPDVTASAVLDGQRVEIVGEAETTLSSHSTRQLLAFLKYVERIPTRALIVAVPAGSKGMVLPLLSISASNWGEVKNRIRVVEGD